MGVFSVVPTPVPTLALQGAQLGGSPDARNFSKVGNQILDSYSKQAAACRAAPFASSSQATPRSEDRQRIQVEILAHEGHSVQTAPVDDATEGQPALQGAWFPSTKAKPALMRNYSKIPSSPRTHSPGPDIKPSLASGIHSARRLRPATASNSFPSSLRIKQAKRTAPYGNSHPKIQAEPARKSDRRSVPFDDSTNDVAAWSPSPISSPRLPSTLPQLFVSSLHLPEYVNPKTPERTARSSGNTNTDQIQLDQLSPSDKELLSMYRKMATSEGTPAENALPSPFQRGNVATLSVMNVEANAVLYDMVQLQHSPLPKPVQADGDIHRKTSPASAIRQPANPADKDVQTDPAEREKSPQRSPVDMTSVPTPMMIQSYTPKRPSTGSQQAQPQADVRVEAVGEMREWRDKASCSRPASAGRPLTVSRPVSARQRRQQHEVEAELASAVAGILVQGHQMDQGRALQQMLEATEYKNHDERTQAYAEADIYEDVEDPDGETDYHRAERSRSDNYRIQQAPALALGVRIGSEGLSVTSPRDSQTPSSQLSRPTSRPTSAGTSRANANPLPVPVPVRKPALIAAEQELERERVKRQNKQFEEEELQHDREEQSYPRQHDHTCDAQPVYSVQDKVGESHRAVDDIAATAVSDDAPRRRDVEGDLGINAREHTTTKQTAVDDTHVPLEAGLEGCGGPGRKGFVICQSCKTPVAISADQVQQQQQQQIVFKYFHENPETHTPTPSRPSSSLDRVPEVPEAGHDFAGRSSSRPSSVSTSVQAARELAELRGRMLEMEQEHEREKTQHRLELEKAEYALKVAQAANSSALAAESRVDSAAKDNDQELELKKLREQLASAEEKLAAAAAAAQPVKPSEATPEPSRIPSADSSSNPARVPSSAKPSPGQSRPSSARRPPASAGSAPGKKDGVLGSKRDAPMAATRDTSTKVDAVEMQNMLEMLTLLKEQLANKTQEATEKQEQLVRTIATKDEQLKRLREESQHQALDASSSQNNELKKMQEDLAKAKKEVQVLRKQRDAKLAVHERQALKEAQDQLKVDQETLTREQEELRAATEIAQKDIADGARVNALRCTLDIKQAELDALEKDLGAQDTKIQQEWQRLHDRQEALSSELEIACGDVRHDRAVLLKELRITLTENAELSEKIAKLQRDILFWSQEPADEMVTKGGESVEDADSKNEAASSNASRCNSEGTSDAPSALHRLPSLSIGVDVANGGEETGDCEQAIF